MQLRGGIVPAIDVSLVDKLLHRQPRALVGGKWGRNKRACT